MTNKVEDYKWSSDRYYRNNKTDFVDIDFILNMISNDRKIAINKYKEFMKDEETGDYENIEVIGEGPTVKKDEKILTFTKTLEEILIETGASKVDIELIKSGSRKRSLTPYKIEYIKKAIENGYLPKEIAEHINSTTPAIINIKERYKF
ncbi:hypothetical protein D2962_16390 [Biomaibacter acetigenes]|uniref:Helix-turn-helix domain-containing protein n=1 Tax=Biomaibacter acetigenes TaxID=2316383 RepID=A0A3G2R965_9FIRM|nr:hypothetical protein [Biomaibacter acetigenes]AYO31963.1 hypothetical protein D2962_16390 [Biomaibacter acetigenes]